MTTPAERSHADDQGAAIELLTAILIDEAEAARRAVRVVHRSAAEAVGLAIGLAKVAVTLLRHVADESNDQAIEVLKTMAPQLHAEALQLDETLGPPLPGSVALKQMEPPDLEFITGAILRYAGVVLSGVGAIAAPNDEDSDEPSMSGRRLLFEVMELLSTAADHFRDTTDWHGVDDA